MGAGEGIGRVGIGRTARPIRLAAALAGLALLFALASLPAAASAADRYLYVSSGAFSPAGSQYVAAFKVNANGGLNPVAGSPFSVAETVTEGLAITPDAKHLYVASFGTNRITGFNINANGSLSAVTGTSFAAGTNANATSVLGVAPDPDGDHIFGWNHGSAIAVLTRNANGSLTNISGSSFAIPAGQSNPFAGSVAPDGDHLYVPHENSADTQPCPAGNCEINRVGVYSVAANGAVASIQGAGQITGTTNVVAGGPNPFGSAITPDGKYLYVSNPEDDLIAGAPQRGTISGFAVNANGTLSGQLFTPLDVNPGNHPLSLAISPDGRRLYAATRASNSITAYNVNANGTLGLIGSFATGGTNGKALAITPDGKYLYVSNNVSDNVSRMRILADGSLNQLGTTALPGTPDSDLESIAITPNQGPTATFTTATAPAGRPTGFDATGSSDPDGTVARYDWNFGDGTGLADGGPIPNHIYAAAGTYTMTLTVTDDEGCSATRIFTGKAMLCNGSSVATTSQQVTIPSAPAPPPPNSFARTVSIKHKQKKDRFKGKVVSTEPACEEDQKVKVFRKKKGNKRKVGVDRTNQAGKWRLDDADAKGRFFARLKETTLANGDTCLAAKSKTLKVG